MASMRQRFGHWWHHGDINADVDIGDGASNGAASSADTTLPAQDAFPYLILEEIGTGHFSTVYRGQHKTEGYDVALKVIDKESIDFNQAHIEREIEIMSRVDHPNVVKLIDVFDKESTFTMVLEFVEGGELFDHIVERGFFSEKTAASTLRQIVEAVQHIHSHNIVHRDLKPENILFSADTDDGEGGGTIKVADFGLSKVVGDDNLLKTACGTPGYVAPEVLLPKTDTGYTEAVDLWSCGVLLYIMLAGYPPFHDNDLAALFRQIVEADYNFNPRYWSHVSDEAKDLISRLLVVDPAERADCNAVLNHPWIMEYAPDDVHLFQDPEHFKSWNEIRAGKAYVHIDMIKQGSSSSDMGGTSSTELASMEP